MKKLGLILSVVFSILLFGVSFVWFGPESSPNRHIEWGLNFSQGQAEYLGLDWREAYLATLDLGAKNYRLAAYWNRLEREKDRLDFSELDFLLSEAKKRDAKILMAVGLKLPRWPECHYPDWARSLPADELQKETLEMLSQTVSYLRRYDNIIAWQVENEPFLPFGECPKLDKSFLKQEVALVRQLDPRPILITESGELSSWANALGVVDLVGISLYRTVWSDIVGRFVYPLTPSFYNRHAQIIKPWASVWVTELQAEPWGSKAIRDMTLEEQRQSFDLDRFERNIRFIKGTSFERVLVWGTEYWYYLKKNDIDSSLWLSAQTLFAPR